MARTFGEYLSDRRRMLPLLDDIAGHNALRLVRRADGEADFHFDGRRMGSRQYAVYIAEMFRQVGFTLAAGIDLFNLTHLMAHGPKVFRPTLEECLALEEVEVNLTVAEYAQPFPTFAVEFPAAYSRQRRMRGTGLVVGVEQEYAPIAQVIHHDPATGIILASTLTDSPDETVLCGIVGSPGAESIEADLGRTLASTEEVNDDERTVERRCCRVAMNAALLLMDRGFRKVVSDEADRASRRLERAKRRGGDGEREARAARRALPTEYRFVQAVNVRRAVRGESDREEAAETGRTVRPHWRSAHWRMQAHGEQRKERRRVLIPRVMVNRDRFAGSDSDTLVVQQ